MAFATEWIRNDDLEAPPLIVEFSRRKFLLAAGGTTLALPVLETLSAPKARPRTSRRAVSSST